MADYPQAYCSLEDIQGIAGETYVASGRTPTLAQVQTFAQRIASELTATVRTAGYVILPANDSGTSQVAQATQDGKDLANLMRMANALGAAARAKRAAFLGSPPSDAQSVIDDLEAEYFKYVGGNVVSSGGSTVQFVEGKIVAFLRTAFPTDAAEAGTGLNSHIISGEVDPPVVTTRPVSPGIQIDMDFRL